MLNPCELIGGLIDTEKQDCKNFADSAVYQGMAVALTRHFENLRYLQTLFVQYRKDNHTLFSNLEDTPYVDVFNNT